MAKIDDKHYWYLKTEDTKIEMIRQYEKIFTLMAMSIFEYKNLPKTLPKWAIELILLNQGRCLIAEYKGELFAYDGGWGGVPDVYYRPTQFIVNNPYQNFNKEFTIGEECVLLKNDSLCMGLYETIHKYADLVTETDITLKIATIMKRMQSIISATDDVTYKSALSYLEKLKKGELGVIMDDGLEESIHTSPYATTGYSLTDLLEVRTYLIHSMYNIFGLQASTNLKRENVSELEASQNADFLLPLIEDMLLNRKEGIEEINKMFGTNIMVDFSDLWKKMKKEVTQEKKEEEKNDEDM